MTGERALDRLLEIHWRSHCILGNVEQIVPLARSDRGVVIVLSGSDENGLIRLVDVPHEYRRMFPDFLVGRRVGIVCRRQGFTALTVRYDFTHLAWVHALSEREAPKLWPWREAAEQVLRNPSIHLSPREYDLCQTLAAYGRPPSGAQRRFFESVRSKSSKKATPETYFRSRRFGARDAEPISLGVALLRALEDLRRVMEE